MKEPLYSSTAGESPGLGAALQTITTMHALQVNALQKGFLTLSDALLEELGKILQPSRVMWACAGQRIS